MQGAGLQGLGSQWQMGQVKCPCLQSHRPATGQSLYSNRCLGREGETNLEGFLEEARSQLRREGRNHHGRAANQGGEFPAQRTDYAETQREEEDGYIQGTKSDKNDVPRSEATTLQDSFLMGSGPPTGKPSPASELSGGAFPAAPRFCTS